MSVTRCRLFAGMTAVVWLALAGPVWAQNSSTPPPPTSNPLRVGSLSLYPGIQVRDVGVDDNVFNAVFVQRREDFTYTVVPRLQAELPVGSSRIVGAGSLGFVYFRTYKDQQSLNGLMQGWFDPDPSARLRPVASGSVLRTRDRIGDDVDTRALRLVTSGRAGLEVRTTAITALTGWVRHNATRYDENELFRGVTLAEELNQTSDAAAAGAKFAVTPLTTIIMAAEVERARFDGSALRDTDSLRLGPSVEFASGAVITGQAAFGYRAFRPRDNRLRRYDGFVGSADLSFTVLNQARFSLSALRDVGYSFDETEPFFMESGGQTTIAQRVVGPVELIVIGGRRRLRYQTVGGGSFDGRVDTITTIGGGIGIRLAEQMRFTLTFDQARRRSTHIPDREYQRNRVLGSIDYSL